MIYNTLCAYCRVKLNNKENHPNSQSVEHLIPNSLTLTKRNNKHGDFYVCKKCNSHKSKMDNLIGNISKFQSFDDKLATDTMVGEYTKEKTNNGECIIYAKDINEYMFVFHNHTNKSKRLALKNKTKILKDFSFKEEKNEG